MNDRPTSEIPRRKPETADKEQRPQKSQKSFREHRQRSPQTKVSVQTKVEDHIQSTKTTNKSKAFDREQRPQTKTDRQSQTKDKDYRQKTTTTSEGQRPLTDKRNPKRRSQTTDKFQSPQKKLKPSTKRTKSSQYIFADLVLGGTTQSYLLTLYWGVPPRIIC